MTLYEKIKDWVNTTNIAGARFWITAFCIVLTTVVYCSSAYLPNVDWEPNLDWLMWLAVMSGIDMGSYWIKRVTHIADDGETVAQKMKQTSAPTEQPNKPEAEEDSSEGLATTDIQELLQDEKG
mgnify:CR=1 FL=1